MSGSDENMLLFIQTFGRKQSGPKSATDRFVNDGEPQSIVSLSQGAYFNLFFIVQAMILQGDNAGRDNLDSRLNSTIRNFDRHLAAKKFAKYIVTENFEKWAFVWWADFTDPKYGNKVSHWKVWHC